MNITIVMGSPHRSGSTALLAGRFAQGATDAGHEVYTFDAGIEPVAPCKACGGCAQTHQCTVFDPMALLASKLPEADLIAFATPIYYFDMSAQLKCVIDRLHMFDKDALWGKRAVFLTSSHSGMEVVQPAMATFDMVCSWFTWKKAGTLHATGVESREQLEATDFPQQAYDLGFGL